jgi:hypothetical protein
MREVPLRVIPNYSCGQDNDDQAKDIAAVFAVNKNTVFRAMHILREDSPSSPEVAA